MSDISYSQKMIKELSQLAPTPEGAECEFLQEIEAQLRICVHQHGLKRAESQPPEFIQKWLDKGTEFGLGEMTLSEISRIFHYLGKKPSFRVPYDVDEVKSRTSQWHPLFKRE